MKKFWETEGRMVKIFSGMFLSTFLVFLYLNTNLPWYASVFYAFIFFVFAFMVCAIVFGEVYDSNK
ncbi:hypothetical protein M0R04_14100 [Candidatus Dojkabacteria bacterium]|jgi:hypothetical protein|nr:hypothetical protein [Candidatus Dojkabacteria bacterium]